MYSSDDIIDEDDYESEYSNNSNGNIRNDDFNDATFSDDEDKQAFGNDPTTRNLYFRLLKPLKHHPRDFSHIFDLGYDTAFHNLDTPAWSRVGLFLGRSPTAKKVFLTGCNLSEESFVAFVRGLKESRSLSEFILNGNPSIGGVGGGTALQSYLACGSCNLVYLSMKGCGVQLESLEIFASAMGQTEIEHLILSDNPLGTEFGRERLSALVKNLISPNLTELSLDKCNIGLEWCHALGNALRGENSQLQMLSLNENLLNDECISVLADALRDNATLRRLNLRNNESITATGLEHIYKLVCNDESMQTTYDSNHSLKWISLDWADESNANIRIDQMTRLNENCSRCGLAQVARDKVAEVHFGHKTSEGSDSEDEDNEGSDTNRNKKNEGFDIRPLLNFDVKLIPHLLAWFDGEYFVNYTDLDIFSSFYRILRHWNVRVLFGFPSAERQRIGFRVDQLESVNAELQSKVSSLEAEIVKLKEENLRLKSGATATMECRSCCKKRKEPDH